MGVAADIIVVGGGMVGAASAFRLQSSGLSTLLVDPGPITRAASFGNAGHIAVEQVEPLSSWDTIRSAPTMLFGLGGPLDFRLGDIGAWGPWALRFMAASGRPRFEAGVSALSGLMTAALPAWSSLLADAGRPDLMRADGHAVLWFNEAEALAGQARSASARTGPATTRPLEAAELAAYARVMTDRPPVAGLKFDGTARLMSPQLTREALLTAFQDRGGQVLATSALSVGVDGAVTTPAGVVRADRVLIAAGVRSRSLIEGMGLSAPVIAERGYSIQFPAANWRPELTTAVLDRRSIVLAPHAEGLRATSYVEFARPDAPADARKWERLETHVRALGLNVPRDPQRWMGCRPTLPDYLPAIGQIRRGPVLYAFGHQHLGVTLAATTADRVLGMTRGDPAPALFDLERFRR